MAKWRRGQRGGHLGPLGQAWSEYLDQERAMAAGGSSTTAYECRVQADRLATVPVTRLRTECATVSDAQERLSRGESVVVAGSDMAQLRQRLASFGIG